MMSKLHVFGVLAAALGCSDASEAPAAACLDPDMAEVAALATADPTKASVTPTQWLALHGTATRPQAKDWSEAVIQLAVAGDAFTLQQLQALDRSKLSPEQQTVLDDTLGSIAARADTAASVAADARSRLERAAWADLRCDLLEEPLVEWTGHSIAAFTSDPAVRAELERLRDGYAPEGLDASTTARMSGRVRGWAQALLESPDPDLTATKR
jgi:hypothetical protein